MYYAQMRKYDVANGPSIRTTLFVSGCTHYCKDCFNSKYWEFDYGHAFDQKAQDELIETIKETGHFSLLGGEPFMQDRTMPLFLERIKKETDADIWAWSGYTMEYLLKQGSKIQKEMLKYIDVLVDGKFEAAKKDLSLKFRGSSNQRIIDAKQTLAEGRVILYPTE